MKNILMILLLLALVCCKQKQSKPSVHQARVNTPGWKTLESADFTVQYPPEWELDQNGELGLSFALVAPTESGKELFRKHINLLIQDLGGRKVDLDKYVDECEEQTKTTLSHTTIIESTRMNDGRNEYQQIHYTGDQGIFHLEFEECFWVKNGKAYILTFTKEKTDSACMDCREIPERILSSFTLKD